MANFTLAFKVTALNAGGYANNLRGRGETYAGIYRNLWPNWQGWTIINQIKASKPLSLTVALKTNESLQSEVASFYKVNFWDVINLDNLDSQQIADQLFDTAVKMGTAIAARFLQQGINALNPVTLVVDASVGPKTIAAANAADDQELYNEILNLRQLRYANIEGVNRGKTDYRNSWLGKLNPFSAASA